ncbi:uncharacterized protein LW93_1015 [Fusarium fujikuroi]|nr:uncharacterized protein LW93_1015 [Fusarium fujikuroi]SCV35234.1 uncharacterized protein FFB14_05424 [Fusarium fujikuroi]
MSNFAIIVAILSIVLVIYVLTRNVRSRAGSTLNMSPDTVSSQFPDRPIRPLPKRRLREKLSPGAVETIAYPPSTHETTPLFYYPPYNFREDTSPPRACSTSPSQQTRRAEEGCNYTPRRNGLGLPDGDDEEPALRSTLVTRSPPEIFIRGTQRSSKLDIPDPQPPPSATSSLDGYDVFENTNNKKKRKIPSPGELSVNGTQGSSNEIAISAGAGNSPTDESHDDRAPFHSVSHPTTGTFLSNNQGISGPGRGRLGRSRNGRSPLRALSDSNSNAWAGRGPKATQWTTGEQESSGIISNAIANAEKLRPQGQENVSLLQQHSIATRSTPASTQFTFTCDSQVPGTVQWPGHSSKHSMSTQAGPGSLPPGSVAPHDGSSVAASRGSGSSRRDSKRRLDRSLERAARRRRREARQDPTKTADEWICEFCEYEMIFGVPPRALIRQYEMKDRRRRQEEADRKRLLEKAKEKSRKARKGAKKPASRGENAAAQNLTREPSTSLDMNHNHSNQSGEDENHLPNSPGDRTGPDIPTEVQSS